MSADVPATEEAQIPAGDVTPDPEVTPPTEGTSSDASPDLASPDTEVVATGDNETGTPPADDPEPVRKNKADRVKELLAERNFWREQAIKGQPVQPAAPEKPAAPEAPPTLEQHGFDTEKWSTAYADWSQKNAAQVVRQELARVEQTKQRQTIAQQFAEREHAFAAATPDYADVVSDPAIANYATPVISEAIVESENGPALSYYLATHHDELAAISRMPPNRQAYMLGRIEAKLATTPAKPAASPKPKPVQQTRAPAPPTPVGGNAPSKRLEEQSLDEYLQTRQRWSPATRA